MKRKTFLRKGIIGLATISSIPIVKACTENGTETVLPSPTGSDEACTLTPTETLGPFPNITPAQLARQNIIIDRTGVAFLINLTVVGQSNECQPLEGLIIDLWHCDREGNYSQYGNTFLQQVDYTDHDFLRGRQVTNEDGKASFISIFPGWYSGRAPHIHLEILNAQENSLLVTQLAFPKEVCDVVYASEGYKGEADTTNERDMFFRDGFKENLLDILEGNITDGYTMEKTIVLSV